MRNLWFNIKQIASIVVFVIVFSLMGMMTERPIMILAYAAVLAIITFAIYLFVSKRQRHSEVSLKKNPIPRYIGGGILSLLAIVTPLYLILKTNLVNIPGEITPVLIVGILGVTILFIALMAVVVYLINYLSSAALRWAAYLILILTSLIPGLLMTRYDKAVSSIGAIYYVALAVLVLAYNGIHMLLPKD